MSKWVITVQIEKEKSKFFKGRNKDIEQNFFNSEKFSEVNTYAYCKHKMQDKDSVSATILFEPETFSWKNNEKFTRLNQLRSPRNSPLSL